MSDVTTRRWTAQPASARGASAALFRAGLVRRPLWLVLASLWLLLTALLAAAFGSTYSTASRVYGGLVYGGLVTAGVFVLAMALAAWCNWRFMRRRLRPGSTWEVTATEDSLTMSGPLVIRLTVPYEAVSMVRVVGAWVLLRQENSPLTTVWPRELLSDATLERIRAARR